MKKNLFVLLFAVGLLSSCDNISYDIMNESNLEKKKQMKILVELKLDQIQLCKITV